MPKYDLALAEHLPPTAAGCWPCRGHSTWRQLLVLLLLNTVITCVPMQAAKTAHRQAGKSVPVRAAPARTAPAARATPGAAASTRSPPLPTGSRRLAARRAADMGKRVSLRLSRQECGQACLPLEPHMCITPVRLSTLV